MYVLYVSYTHKIGIPGNLTESTIVHLNTPQYSIMENSNRTIL